MLDIKLDNRFFFSLKFVNTIVFALQLKWLRYHELTYSHLR